VRAEALSDSDGGGASMNPIEVAVDLHEQAVGVRVAGMQSSQYLDPRQSPGQSPNRSEYRLPFW